MNWFVIVIDFSTIASYTRKRDNGTTIIVYQMRIQSQ